MIYSNVEQTQVDSYVVRFIMGRNIFKLFPRHVLMQQLHLAWTHLYSIGLGRGCWRCKLLSTRYPSCHFKCHTERPPPFSQHIWGRTALGSLCFTELTLARHLMTSKSILSFGIFQILLVAGVNADIHITTRIGLWPSRLVFWEAWSTLFAYFCKKVIVMSCGTSTHWTIASSYWCIYISRIPSIKSRIPICLSYPLVQGNRIFYSQVYAYKCSDVLGRMRGKDDGHIHCVTDQSFHAMGNIAFLLLIILAISNNWNG